MSRPEPRDGRMPRLFRPITPGAAHAFVFLALLTLLLAGASSWFAIRAVQGEIANRASVTQLCQAGNESRAQQVALWAHLAAISGPPPHETAEAKRRREAAVAGLLRYVRQVFAPRDCSHLSAG